VVMMGRIAKLGWLGLPKKKDWDFVHAALDTVGMGSLSGRQIGELSGGQQQRMFIARALAQEAELMLMDEPLTGLDTPSQEALLSLLGDLQKRGVTVMVATHDLEQAERYFDSILLLNHKLVAFGAARDVLKSDVLLHAYGGKLNKVDGKYLTDTCCEEGDHEHTH